MTTYNLFYNSNREILWATTAGVSSEIISNESLNGNSYLQVETEDTPTSDKYYVNADEDGLVEKSIFLPVFSTITPAIDEVINVTGLPSGTEVFVDNVSAGIMSDTTLTFTVQEPGIYKIKFSKDYYKVHSPVTINVKRYGE